MDCPENHKSFFNPHPTLWLGVLGLKISKSLGNFMNCWENGFLTPTHPGGEVLGDTGREGGRRKVGVRDLEWRKVGGGRREGGRREDYLKVGVRELEGRKLGGGREGGEGREGWRDGWMGHGGKEGRREGNHYPFLGVTSLTGPQEGVCNWCGQLGGGRVGKGVIIITCADPVHEKKFPVITMIPTKTLTPKIIHKHNFIGCDPWSTGDCCLIYEGGATSIANFCCQITTEQFDKVQFTQKHVIMLIKTVGYRHCHLSRASK